MTLRSSDADAIEDLECKTQGVERGKAKFFGFNNHGYKNSGVEKAQAQKVIRLQLIITGIVAAAFGFSGLMSLISAMFGGLVSVSTTLLLNVSVMLASRVAVTDPKKSMVVLYVGAAQRFVMVAVLLALGIGLVDLQPLPVIVGFAVAQLSFVISSTILSRNTNHQIS